jgi:NADPH:quinone reductase-like Zn-dependent oxidoreductase
MRAAVYREFGGPEVVRIEEVATPEPGQGEVRIKVAATTVSVADHRMRAKDLPRGLGLLAAAVVGISKPNRSVLGMDFAGTIDRVGPGVTRWRVGQEVVGLTGDRFGGHAEFVCLPEGAAMVEKPAALSFADAVSVVFGGHTAAECLRQAPVTPGQLVLVNGAAGAVGSMAVQLCAHFGAEVTAVTSARNIALVRDLGAKHVIDYATRDFAVGSETYDTIYECVGNAPFSRIEGVLKPGGTHLLVVGDLVAMLGSMLPRRAGKRSKTISFTPRPEDVALEIDLLAQGAVRPVIEATLPFEQIVEAHRLVDTGRKRGAVVVTM